MLIVNDVKKKFTKIDKNKKKIEFYADNGISFKVGDGTIFGILGPNGAGKTTLLRMIGGILEPTEGTIKYDNLNYKENEIDIKKQIAYLSGNTKLYNNFSCVELLRMCNNIYGVNKQEGEKRIKEVIDKLGMNDYANSRIGNLSTGQTQKVNIARCLVHDPKYYILDEATSGLDIVSSQIILDFIKEEKKRGKTILYSTHYMEEAENICDYIIMLNKGVVIKEGTPLKIKEETNTSNLRDAFFKVLGDDSNE